uniref:Alpha/beta hydrolase fold-3 domain-containing protein n=1 Tax=Panagrolaimus davidi TaxID=227884 RepID=A0A914PJM5_9BILA
MSSLEKLFSPSQWNHKGKSSEEVIQEFIEVTQKSYEEAKKKIIALRDVDYGPNKLDIWGANATDATHVFIYFHGGYWQAGSKADVGPMIDLVVNGAGIPCVSVGYDYATNKSLKEIAAQALTALKFIENRFMNAVFTVSGHSAGAYLAASAVSNLEDPRRIKQVILISGIYELAEFAQTSEGRNIQ